MNVTQKSIKTLTLPTQNGNNHSLCASMSSLGNFVVFPYSKTTGQAVTLPIQIQEVKRVSWLSGRTQRKLINESMCTFLSLQKGAKDAEKETEKKSLLVKKLREYRSMIQACVSEQKENGNGIDSPQMEDTQSEIKIMCELLYKMELILGLVEVTFLDSQVGGAVLNQLLQWIRFHFPQCQQTLQECLNYEQPHTHPSYWEACFGLVLQGSLDEARDLLSQHPSSNSDSFLSMDELLRKMPVYLAYSGVSEAEFIIRWQHWQGECENRKEKGEFADCDQLEKLCSVLCGNRETIISMTNILDTWYHLMVSELLYSNPTVKIHRLPSAANDAIISFVSDSPLSALDQLIVAVLEVNHHQVIKLCQTVLDNLWFTVHLVDIFHHSLDKKSELGYIEDIRESLLVDYATDLASHGSLWQLSLLYLDHCDAIDATPFAKAILERVPLTDDSKAMKVIQAAADRGLDTVAHSTCCVMGRRALRRGQLGSAIWWGIRSLDSAFTSHLAHQILRNYMESGRFDSSSLLDNLPPLMIHSETLTFLSKYREFHVLYQEGNLKAASTLLVGLMSSKVAPEYFWPVLLEDTLPLLQSPEPVISAEQTYYLLDCLQNLSSDKGSSSCQYASFFAKETDLRLALTNNLARSIIQEGTVRSF